MDSKADGDVGRDHNPEKSQDNFKPYGVKMTFHRVIIPLYPSPLTV